MRILSTLLVVTLVAACGGEADEAPAEESAAPTMEAEGPSMADLAGTWNAMAMLDGVEEPVASEIVVAENGTWIMTLTDRDPMMMDMSMSGDSTVLTSPEYESVIREGVMVTVRTALVFDGDNMMGTLQATYRTPEGTEIVGGTLEGSRGGM